MTPSNPKATGAGDAPSASRDNTAIDETAKGVRAWERRIEKALKKTNPSPVTFTVPGVGGAAPSTETWTIRIKEFEPVALPVAAEPADAAGGAE